MLIHNHKINCKNNFPKMPKEEEVFLMKLIKVKVIMKVIITLIYMVMIQI